MNTEFSFAENWTKGDTYREIVFLSLHFLDWQTTLDVAKQPQDYQEYNPILGKHPTVSEVNNYFLLTGATHIILSYYLPNEYRRAFQYITIGISGTAVTNNLSCGLKFQF